MQPPRPNAMPLKRDDFRSGPQTSLQGRQTARRHAPKAANYARFEFYWSCPLDDMAARLMLFAKGMRLIRPT